LLFFRTGDHPTYPICVDLDGTLVHTDLLYESLAVAARSDWTVLFKIPLWLTKGRSHLKRQLAQRGPVRADVLPYRKEVVAWLRQEHANGRHLILATGADEALARDVAKHLGIFSEVIGSHESCNLIREAKAAALVERFGKAGFSYVGDSNQDLPVWQEAAEAIVVARSPRLIARVKSLVGPKFVHLLATESPSAKLLALLRCMRPHQWAKNVLVFLPIIAGHAFFQVKAKLLCLLGFVAFSLCASAVYLLNDLIDLDADRRHPTKCKRPLAAGSLPIPLALLASGALAIIAFGIAAAIPGPFAWILAAYLALTNIYSFYLKSVAFADVICLGLLYTLRIFAGSAIADIRVSKWLFAFSMFFFVSLALAKRVAELRLLMNKKDRRATRRNYGSEDIQLLTHAGLITAVISLLVLALYISHPLVSLLYTNPERLWIVEPLMLFWLARVWQLTSHGKMHIDPVVFAIKDRVSYVIGGIVIAAAIWAL
jgi:4-hydroxybenzoate polyprenyltransferase/phosphoserine phosphatase